MPIQADIYDTLDGSTDSLLENHTGQIGATWAHHPGGGDVDWTGSTFSKEWRLDGAGGVYPAVYGYRHTAYLASGIPSNPEFDIRAPFVALSDTGGDNFIGVFFFGDPSTPDFWFVGYHGYWKEWRLGIVVNKSFEGFGGWGDTHNAGFPVSRAIEIRVRNASPKVALYVDGIQRVTSDDARRPGNRIGLYATCGGPPAADSGLHITQISMGPIGYALPMYSVSGPSSGPPGFVSEAYTASLYAGENPGSITITPSTTGVAGVFNPANVTLTNAARSGTFTFTPSGSGTATISLANNVGSLDPPSMTYTSIFAPPERVAAWASLWGKFHTTGSAPYLAGSTNPNGSGGYYLDKDDHYDPILIYYMVQDYCIRNGLPLTNWSDQIQAGITRFRDRAVRADPGLAAGEGYGVQEYHRYATGILWHHFTTNSASELAKNIEALGYLNKPNFGSYFDAYSNPGTYREAAFVLNTLLDFQLMGLGDRLANVKEAIRTCLYQNVQTSIQGPTRRYGISIKPFMVGINNWVLARCWEMYRGTADATLAALIAQIPASIKAICQYMWDVCWFAPGPTYATDVGDWNKGAISYKDLALSDPMWTPLRNQDITTYTNRTTFRGPASLSTTDDYYKDSYLKLNHPSTGQNPDTWVIGGYTGATRQITVAPFYIPSFDFDDTWSFDIVPAMWQPLESDGDRGPSPGMNGMAMFGFAFTYWHMRQVLGDDAGSQQWRIRAHALFNGASQAWQAPYDSKLMHQGVYLAIPALEYLARGDTEWPVASTFNFQAPATGAQGNQGVASGPFRISIPYGQRLANPELIDPATGSGLGTFSAPDPILTNSLRKAMFTYTPAPADDGKIVQVSALGSSMDPSGFVAYTVGTPSETVPVTSYSFDGPTSGEINVSAGYFLVALGAGTLAAPVRIVPAQSAGTGIFIPTYIDLSDSTRSGIFQFVPFSPGVRSLTVSNNKGLTNPSPLIYNALPSTAPPPAPVDDTPKPTQMVPVPMAGPRPSWMIKT
jgi:hypothetical protein